VGPRHELELLAADHVGAASASARRFRVTDTRPPLVTAPAPLPLGCTQPGGASGATSPQLHAFLGGARAVDVSDPAPVLLAPQVGGVDVTDATLFPLGARSVQFRARDASGNLGTASSTVAVTDPVPPAVGLTVSPSLLPADLRFHLITATLTATDNCGGPVALKLVSLTSNLPPSTPPTSARPRSARTTASSLSSPAGPV
jgi:hypothetical protein